MLVRILLACCALIAPVLGAAAQDNIGVAAAVKERVTGELGATRRVLVRGDRMFQNEKVATDRASSLEVLFLDETNLSMGPDTTIVLDRFIYDPNGSSGGLAVTVAIGVTRFVTGIMPKQDYEIRTPTVVIGVRGTVFDLFVAANGDSTVVLRAGELNLRQLVRGGPPSQPVGFATPGLAVTVNQGQPPGPPGAIPPHVARALALLPAARLGLAGLRPPDGPGGGAAPGRPPIPPRIIAGAYGDTVKKKECKPHFIGSNFVGC